MNMTHLITLDPITGAVVRVPFDLDTGAIDWLHAAPHTEPPSLVHDSSPHKCKYRRYSICVRIEQIRIAMQQVSNPTHQKIADKIGISRARVSQIFRRLDE